MLPGNMFSSSKSFAFLATFPSFPSLRDLSKQYWNGWLEIGSHCFWSNLFVFVHLCFISTFSAQFLWKRIRKSCCNTSMVYLEDNNAARHELAGISFGIPYQISKICCALLLINHFGRLTLFLLDAKRNSCNQSLSVAAELIQLISWTILLVSILSLPQKNSIKISHILRVWMTCIFIQSTIEATFNISSNISGASLAFLHISDLLSLSGCIFLFGISVKGTIGITYSPNIEEPLLETTTRKDVQNNNQSPYANASFLQLVTFSWLNPLIAKGKTKPLEQDEVPKLDTKDSAEFLAYTFESYLNQVMQTHGLHTSSIYKVIFLFIRKKAVINATFAVINAGVSFVGPSLIDNFVKFLSGERKEGLKDGYILAFAFLTAKVVETIAQRQWIFGARRLGMRLRAALISSIYKKGLSLSSRSRQSRTSGEIINYMSVDIQRITDVIWYANTIWMFPVQISLAMCILYKSLGVGAFAGLTATAMILACNIPLVRAIKELQPKIMESKDERMKATSEVLHNIKILKLQAWDLQYLHKLEDLRNVEYNWLKKSVRLQVICACLFWGAPAFISVITFGVCMLVGIPLTAGRVLSALATFKMLQEPIFNLPDLLSVLAMGKVSADRIAMYLQEEEIKSDTIEIVPRSEAKFDIEINHGIFSWNTEALNPTLENIQLEVRKGMKVAICGTVGSGKSSLLSCILGEIPKLGGTVRSSGTKAYVPQSPWILSGNVRENIMFGKPFNKQKYNMTIQSCALKKDFELFANGDLTEIGERGINMSGGQKQRIQIARAVYQDADVYLLDDPFSALDAQTGAQLFKDCLMGMLKNKTILYVTHQVEFLPAADLVLVMQNGKIKQAGKFDELLRENIGFEVLVGAHNQALESVLNAEISSRIMLADETKKQQTSNCSYADEKTENSKIKIIQKQDHVKDLCQDISDKGRLTQDEEREKGSIGKEVYWSYLTAAHRGALVPIIILSHTLFQIFLVASNYWMAWASPLSMTTESTVGIDILLLVYVMLSITSSLCVLIRAMLVGIAGLLTSQKFFKDMLRSIIHAPMSFFDSTPTGRILNRASSDQSVLDTEMAGRLGWCAFSVIQFLGTILVMSQVAWPFFIIFIPVTAICLWYQQYYIPTSRELVRLSEIQRAPILHHFAETLSGATTIRAFEQKSRFSSVNLHLADNHSRPWFHNISAMEWLAFRLNMLSNFVFAFSLILLVSLPEGFMNPSIAGLAVTYGLNLNSQIASIIWNVCNTENKIISVERILQYSNIPSEAPLIVENNRPPENWPEIGTICFKNLEIRYIEHLPSVLKNISCKIPGRKKVGVVGRTGSGKSTLMQALFRIVEPRQGTIEIDGVDICKIGLHDLRLKLGIIPQEPILFEGTVRGNLDPLKEYPDNKIWEILDKCQLGDLVRQNDQKLDSIVVENGENWSVGQRQLFCLGRALLKRSSILVLDEATASVDSATDATLQDTIRQEFSNCTVLTIAHRINTVIDSDFILVLGEGRILEYDKPSKLLEREDSSFSKLIKEYSMRSKQHLLNETQA